MEAVRTRTDKDTPDILKNYDVAKAFYGVVYEVISRTGDSDGRKRDIAARVGIGIDEIILKHKVVDWHLKQDVQNAILNELEDYLHDHPELDLSWEEIDKIMEKVLHIAKRRYAE